MKSFILCALVSFHWGQKGKLPCQQFTVGLPVSPGFPMDPVKLNGGEGKPGGPLTPGSPSGPGAP